MAVEPAQSGKITVFPGKSVTRRVFGGKPKLQEDKPCIRRMIHTDKVREIVNDPCDGRHPGGSW